MNLKRAELIQSLQNVKTSLRPDDASIMEAHEVAKALHTSVSKTTGNSDLASDIKQQFQKALGEGVSVEKEWRPQATSMKIIMDRVLLEATTEERKNPNAMRLNLQSMVLDKTHAKFSITRNGVDALIELLYPNVNDKITLKVSVKGADDNLVEVGLEDQPYLIDMGVYILQLVDETVANSVSNQGGEIGSQGYFGGQGGDTSGFPPMWESDSREFSSLMSLVEEEEDDEELDIDIGGVDDALGTEGGVDAGFSDDDFAIDAGGEVDTGDFSADFGGDFGGGDFGAEGSGGVNASPDDIMGGEVDDTEWETFRDKTDWLQSSLDSMQQLTSSSVAQKMQQGTGVVLTSDEIMNGSVGLKNDMPVDVIDKFLNVYPELDNIELKENDLEQIEEKLSLGDGQFDAWLQQKLPEITGQDEVSDTLDNDMFEEFDSMGGEKSIGDDMELGGDMGGAEDATPEASFEQFLDDVNPAEETSPEEMEAEAEVNLDELPELPNI